MKTYRDFLWSPKKFKSIQRLESIRKNEMANAAEERVIKRQIIGFFTSSVDVHQMPLVFDYYALTGEM